MVVWGSGTPRFEFLYVDDMFAASVHVMNLPPDTWRANVQPMCSHLNVGSGQDHTIHELAEQVAQVVGYEGAIRFDTSKTASVHRAS